MFSFNCFYQRLKFLWKSLKLYEVFFICLCDVYDQILKSGRSKKWCCSDAMNTVLLFPKEKLSEHQVTNLSISNVSKMYFLLQYLLPFSLCDKQLSAVVTIDICNILYRRKKQNPNHEYNSLYVCLSTFDSDKKNREMMSARF